MIPSRAVRPARRTSAAALAILAAAAACAPASPGTPSPASEAGQALAVVQSLFDHMRAGDADAMAALFHPEARLVTTSVQAGEPVAQTLGIAGWLSGVRGATVELDERIYDPAVRVEQGLAMVWTEYSLFVDGELSHCGVDLFDLVRTSSGWRIIQVVDTRKRTDCRTS